MKELPVTLAVAAVLLGVTLSLPLAADKGGVGSARLQLVEATIEELQKALQTKLLTSEQLVEMYHARIAAYEPLINAYIHVNANADVEAAHIDARRHPGAVNGPLYGIPILLKDNIDTADMPTTAGSVALAGSIPPDDAFIVQKLRQAGAIILGKATLTEYANFLAIGMPTGYSSLGGFGFNPYDPRVDPRITPPFNDGRPVLQTGGSSSGSGIGVNANLAPIAIGTETSGSILSPANANGIVGIKPTVGLVSRDGIIPITADQDTAGPLTRTVADAAILLGVIAGHDPNDPATEECLIPGRCFSDYTQFLNRRALRGARIAVYSPPTPLVANRQAVIDNAVAVLRAQGASVRTLAVYRHSAAARLLRLLPAAADSGAARSAVLVRAPVRVQARPERVPGGHTGGAERHARRDRGLQQHLCAADEVRSGDCRSGRADRPQSRKRRHAPLPGRPRVRSRGLA